MQTNYFLFSNHHVKIVFSLWQFVWVLLIPIPANAWCHTLYPTGCAWLCRGCFQIPGSSRMLLPSHLVHVGKEEDPAYTDPDTMHPGREKGGCLCHPLIPKWPQQLPATSSIEACVDVYLWKCPEGKGCSQPGAWSVGRGGQKEQPVDFKSKCFENPVMSSWLPLKCFPTFRRSFSTIRKIFPYSKYFILLNYDKILW